MTHEPIDAAKLAALVDGELAADEVARIEAAAAQDASLAARLKVARDLRHGVAAAYAEAAAEPVPERLLRAARGAGEVVDLARVRAGRDRRGLPRSLVQWGALAASLAAAFVVGRLAAPRLSPSAVIGSDRSGAMLAEGPLAQALQTQLAATQSRDAPVKIGVSFQAASGDFCRTFTTRGGASLAGVACREPRGWRIQMAMAASPAAGSTYRLAGEETPAPVLQAMDQLIRGAPLDAAGEASAKAAGWRPKP
jgi:hypothetical protein